MGKKSRWIFNAGKERSGRGSSHLRTPSRRFVHDGLREGLLAEHLHDLGKELELVCCRELLAVGLFVVGCGTEHGLAETRDLFICELIEVLGVLFALLYAGALFWLQYGVELHVEPKLVRLVWGEIIEVFLGDLFPLALFLGLAAVCAALGGAFLLGGPFLLIGIARLFGREGHVLLDGGRFRTLARRGTARRAPLDGACHGPVGGVARLGTGV